MRHTWGWDWQGVRGGVGGSGFSFRLRRMSAASDLDMVECALPFAPGEEPKACGFDALYGFLHDHGDDPAAARALAAVGGMLPPGTFELIDRHPEVAARDEMFYLCDWRRRDGRVAAALRHPGLAIVLSRVASRVHGRNGEPAGIEPRDLLAVYAPQARPGSIRSVLRMDRAIPTLQVLDALLALPPERHPGDDAERDAFEAVVMASQSIAHLMGDHAHLASADKGWVAFSETLGRRMPEGSGLSEASVDPLDPDTPPFLRWRALRGACSDVEDVVRAFSRQVLMPLAHARGTLDEERLLRLTGGPFSDRGLDVTMAAARILFSGKSLPAILELSAEWHARQRAMDAAVEGLAATFPQPAGHRARPGAWPVPFPVVTAPNGVEIAFLASQDDLGDEGGGGPDRNGVPGMGHCVSSYGHACSSGRSAVASLRLRLGNRVERLSTVEVSVGARDVRVTQHRGKGNASPPRAARKALEWFEGEIRARRLVPNEDYMASGWRYAGGRGGIAGSCGYGHLLPGAVEAAIRIWSPFLTRPARDPDTLSERGAALLLALDEESRPRPRPASAAIRKRIWKGLDGYLRVTLLPLKAGEDAAAFLEARVPGFPRLAATIAFTLAIEGLLLWAVHAAAGRTWAAVLAAQVALPAFELARPAAAFPRALRRTLGHMARARALNASFARPAEGRPRPGRPMAGDAGLDVGQCVRH